MARMPHMDISSGLGFGSYGRHAGSGGDWWNRPLADDPLPLTLHVATPSKARFALNAFRSRFKTVPTDNPKEILCNAPSQLCACSPYSGSSSRLGPSQSLQRRHSRRHGISLRSAGRSHRFRKTSSRVSQKRYPPTNTRGVRSPTCVHSRKCSCTLARRTTTCTNWSARRHLLDSMARPSRNPPPTKPKSSPH